MLWDEEAIKRRWSKSSRNKKKKKKLSLHDQQLPPRTRTRRAVPNQSECQVLTTPKKEQTPSPVLDACSLTETKKNKKNNTTTTTHQQQPTTNNQQPTTTTNKQHLLLGVEPKGSAPSLLRAPCQQKQRRSRRQERHTENRAPPTPRPEGECQVPLKRGEKLTRPTS